MRPPAAWRIGPALLALCWLAGPADAADEPRTLYLLHCSGCHGMDGSGSRAGRVPGMAGVDKVLLHPDGRLFLSNVPGIKNSGLADEDIARLLNWAVHYWGEDAEANAGAPITAEEVGRFRKTPPDDLAALRASIAADLKARGVDIGTYSGN